MINREFISLALGTLRWQLVQTDRTHAELRYLPMEGNDDGLKAAAHEISRALPDFTIQSVATSSLKNTSSGKWHYVSSLMAS